MTKSLLKPDTTQRWGLTVLPHGDGGYDELVEAGVVVEGVEEAVVGSAAGTAAVADGGVDETAAAAAAGDGEG